MYKQEAISLLRERMRYIPCSDTLHTIVLYQSIKGLPSIVHANPAQAEAVDVLGRNSMFSFLMGKEDAHVSLQGYATFCQTLDGDMELIVNGPAEWPSPLFGEYQRVLLRRRQPRLRSSTDVIPVALRIPAEYRDLLPATAGIVAAEGKFVIVASRASSDELRKLSGEALHKPSDREHLRAIRELQQYFTSQWANDTHVVFRIPPEDQDRISRTNKNQYFHSRHCENPIAGYADYIVTASYAIQRYDVAGMNEECHVTVKQYGPSVSGDAIRTETYYNGGEELSWLLVTLGSLNLKVICNS